MRMRMMTGEVKRYDLIDRVKCKEEHETKRNGESSKDILCA